MTKKLTALFLLVLAGCATTPQFGAQDRTALQPNIDTYHSCLEGETTKVMGGSNDVRFMTNIVLRNCDDKLDPIANYLRGRGFGYRFVHNYVQNLRYNAGNTVASHILHANSTRAKSSSGQ